jgi:hypothetical protein
VQTPALPKIITADLWIGSGSLGQCLSGKFTESLSFVRGVAGLENIQRLERRGLSLKPVERQGFLGYFGDTQLLAHTDVHLSIQQLPETSQV